MSVEENEKKEASRKYVKPRLRTIELVADEVLASGCKMSGSAAPGSPLSCMENNCSQDGS